MSTRFSNLTEDAVQLIFDRISTRHLLNTRRVSRAWQHNQRLNCRRRKSLIIFQGGEAVTYGFINQIYTYPFINHNIDLNGNPRNHTAFILNNKILISTKKCPNVQFLIETFPHLHTLIVSTDLAWYRHFQSLVHLITHFSSKLVNLQLYFDGVIESDEQETFVTNVTASLINQLNSMTSLQHLTIDAEDLILNPQIEEPEFVTRIKEIYFDFGRLEKAMLDWVKKYDHAGRLDQLERFYLSTRSVAKDLPFIDRIEHVPLANLYPFSPYHEFHYNQSEEYLKKLVATFISLSTFEYCLSSQSSIKSLTKLTTILSPLIKLVHVHLEIKVVSSNESLEPNSTAQLKSLKALDLMFDRHNINLLPAFCRAQVPIIVQCFPNLQSVKILAQDFPNPSNKEINEHVEQFFVDLKLAYKKPLLTTDFSVY